MTDSKSRPNAGPNPNQTHPLPGVTQVAFLKPVVDHPMVEIGDYTYYDDPDGPERFLETCVRYHFEHMGDRLRIGRYCAIASKVQFIMNGANHALDGFSTYPFAIFGHGWEDPELDWSKGSRGDIIVGNDVWIGREAVIMPGVTIGDGAIIGARSVVASDVPPFGVVAGNPARLVKRRFPDDIIDRLLTAAWWDWAPELVTRHIDAIRGADIEKLEAARKG